MNPPSILYLAINLPSSDKRREQVLAEGRKCGIDIQIVPAVAGKTLTEEDLSHYDRKARRKAYPFDLTPNEIACTLSHRKALRTFLDSEADFGVILEDDALLQPQFAEGLAWLTQKLRGWQIAKLYTAEGKLYSVGMDDVKDAPVRPVFPKKVMWVSVGYLYTREGARRLLEGLEHFWLSTDAQIGHVMLNRRIPVVGIEPGLVITADPFNESSDIDADASASRRSPHPERSTRQYIAYRLSVWAIAWGKMRMRRLLRSVLHLR